MNNTVTEYFSTKTILYVEDEKEVRESVQSYLEMIFSSVTTASNGEEAFLSFNNNEYDVILTDLEMPKLDGLEFVSRMREKGYETPVIVMSAFTTPEFTIKASELKLVKYLVKPFDGDLFLEALEKTKEEIIKLNENNSLKKTITDLKSQIEDIEYYSMTDHLTGLLNRRSLESIIEKHEKEFFKNRSDYGVVFIDIDFFKKVNDTYGHEAGDCVLKEVGKIISYNCGELAVAGRYGGEEFVSVVSGVSIDEVFEFAEKIRESIESAEIQLEKETLRVTASLGVALRSSAVSEAKTLEQADKCMYEAKKTGRNKTVKEV